MINILFNFGDLLFWLYALVVFVLVLGTIVLLHEGGHFFFAKKAGILCHEYAIGMGPVVKSVKKGETSYSIRAIPIGGFVSMAGEDTNESLLREGQTVSISFKEVSYKDLFYGKELENGDEIVKVISEISVTDKAVKEITGKVVSYDLYSKDGEAMFIELDINGEHAKFLVPNIVTEIIEIDELKANVHKFPKYNKFIKKISEV
jgi:regulator of sigma E protease